jgi:hypothetical protein
MTELPPSLEPSKQHLIEVGEILAQKNAQLNSGRGINAISDIALMLIDGDLAGAKATIRIEYDKISSYKDIMDWMIEQGLYEPIDLSKYRNIND